MKVRYKALAGKLEFEVEGSTEKELFKSIAKLEEVFRGEPCGLCKKNNIRLQVRTVEDNDFFELKCEDCNATLSFGQHKKGGSLFPKRKDKDDKWLPNKGWSKWMGNKIENAGK
jgi:hypothetical protein